MTIYTVDKKTFELRNETDNAIAQLSYTSSAFNEATIESEENFLLKLIATATWITLFKAGNEEKAVTKIKVEIGGIMSIRGFSKRKKYLFKKSANFKLRFSLLNKEGEDMLTLVPSVNWQKQSHDFVLQLNEEFEKECDAFLILQALHCANCTLSMMEGGKVPALVSM